MKELVPTEFYLSQNFPNPFKEKTTIKYCVAYKTTVQLTVYELEGKVVEKLVDEEKEAGTYKVEFSVCHSGEVQNPAAGIYKYLFVAGYQSIEKIMTIEK